MANTGYFNSSAGLGNTIAQTDSLGLAGTIAQIKKDNPLAFSLSGEGNLPNDTPWYQNSEMLGNVAGLGSSLVQLAALPSQISLAKTQKKALEHNLATAKEEQARRNKNISSFNAVRA